MPNAPTLHVRAPVRALALAAALCGGAFAHAQPSADSPSITNAWRAWRDALHARAATLDPRDLAERERELSRWLDELDRRLPAPPASLARVPVIGPALHDAARAQREAAIARVVARVHPQAPVLDDPAVETETRSGATRLAAWYARAEALAADLSALRGALDSARALDEGGDASPRAVVARWTREGLLREPAVARAAAPVTDRVAALERIAVTADSAALLDAARSAGEARPEQLFAAWRRLGERPASPWPAAAADLRAETDLRPLLLGAARAAPDAARARALAEEVRIGQRQRLMRVLNTVTDDDTLRAAGAAMEAFGVDPAMLDGRVRYNLLLLALKDDVASLADPAARVRIRAFVEQAAVLPGGVGYLAGSLPTVRTLEAIADGAQPGAAPADPGLHGPAGVGLQAVERDGRVLVTLPGVNGAGSVSVEFVRVSADSGDAFVTTHEVTVGQVGAIVAARGAERALVEVQPHFTPLNDTRAGPRSWVWGADAHGLPVVLPAPSWLSPAAILAGADYPPGQAPAKPGPDSPMQHLRPAAAAYIASLLNCRLPTVAEWAALARALEPEVLPGRTNLRDARWARYRDHIAAKAASGRLVEPAAAGAFIPQGFPVAFEGGEALRWDDGWLFFAPASMGLQDGQPHVLGNVAELVTTDVWPSPQSPAHAIRTAKDQAQQLRVVGASALSHLQIDPFVPYEIDPIDAGEGYADVGFRLAFSALDLPRDDGVARAVQRALTPTPYLKPR